MPVDYNALAKQSGALSSAPPPRVDYNALAKQAGAVSSQPAAAAPPWYTRARQFVGDTLSKTAQNLDVTPMLQRLGDADSLAGQGRWGDAWNEVRDILPGGSAQNQVLGNQQGTYLNDQKDFARDTIAKAKSGDYSGVAANALTVTMGNAEHVPAAVDATKAAVAKYAVPVAEKAGEAVTNARAAASDALQSSAEKNIDTALHPTKNANKALTADKIAPGLAERGVVATSLKDLQAQAEAKRAEYGEQINAIFDQHADAGTKLSAQPILEKLEQEKQAYVVDGVPINPAYVDRVAAMQKQIEQVSAANGGDIPLASLRRIRQIHDEIVDKSRGGFALPPDAQSAVSASKTYGDAIRSTFADNVPELADANREYSFWANTDKVVSDSLLRKTGQRSPLTTKVMQGIGAFIGHHIAGTEGAIVGAYAGGKLAQLKGSTLWNTLSANAKMRVADLLDAGDEAGARAVAQNPANQTRAAAPAPAAAANAPAPAAAPPAATPPPGSDATVVKVPGEPHNSYPAVYRVRELDDVQPSHNGLTFSENPKYGLDNQRDYETGVNQGKVVNGSLPSQFDPTFHITDNPDTVNGPPVVDTAGNTLGGNGRVMIIQRVYAGNGKAAAAYRDTLTKKAAQFGIDPADVAAMKRPVLVREVSDSAFTGARSKADAIADFNKTGTAALTPAERAISDSQRVSPATLADMGARLEAQGEDATLADVLNNGKAGAEILDNLVKDGVVTTQERAAFQDSTGKLTKAGRERVSALMLGRFFRDPEQLESVAPGVRQKIERMAAPLAQAETAAPEWDLTPHLRDAVDLLERARAVGTKNLDDFVKQEDLLGADKYPAETLTLARALQGKSAKELTAGARQYAADANEGAKGDGLFGAAPEPGKSLADAFGGKPAAKPQSGAETQAAEALAQAKSGKTAPAESLYPSLFAKLKAGDTTDAGKTSNLLTLAKPLVDSGEISTPDELRAFAQKVYGKPAKAKAAAAPIPPPAARSGSGSPAALGDIGKK